MGKLKTRQAGWYILMLAYPLTHILVSYIPNPFVPTASLALNMIFPVLAGYFYGPVSGALAGAIGTALSGLIWGDLYDITAVIPHMFMGLTAGFTGNKRAELWTALTIIIGHGLNIIFFWRFNLLTFEKTNFLILGLVTETTIDIVAIILLIVVLQKYLYQDKRNRW